MSRELKRNRGQRGYRPQQAHALAAGRKQKSVPRITTEVWAIVESLLKQDWSPEQISGRLKKEQKVCISHEWIYQYVLKDKQAGGDIYRHLRCQKKRRKRYGKYDRRGERFPVSEGRASLSRIKPNGRQEAVAPFVWVLFSLGQVGPPAHDYEHAVFAGCS